MHRHPVFICASLWLKFTLQHMRENFEDLDQLIALDRHLPFKWLSKNLRRVAFVHET